MILHIKNMVCPRCIMAVTSTLSQLGLTPDSVSLRTLPRHPTNRN